MGGALKKIRMLFLGLRTQVILIILACCLPLLFVAVYSFLELHKFASQKAERDATRLIQKLSRDEQRWLTGATQLLKALTESPTIQKSDAAECSQYLAGVQQHDPYLKNVMVLNPSGWIECSAVPVEQQKQLIGESFFHRALKSRGFATGDFRLDPITKSTVIDFAYADFGPDHLKRLMVSTIGVDWFKDFIDGEQLPKDASLLVLDPKFNVLYANKELQNWFGKNVADSSLINTLKASGFGTTTEAMGLDAKQRLYTFRILNGNLGGNHRSSRMVMVLGLPLKTAYEGIDKFVTQYSLVTGISVLALLLFGWIGSKTLILRKVDKLMEATQRIASGDFSARIKGLHGSNEVTTLACHFNDMAEMLQIQQSELARITRAREMLQLVNRTIVHSQNEDQLISQVCHIAIEQGLFQVAWIGSVNWEDKVVQQRALVGDKTNVIKSIPVSFDKQSAKPNLVQQVIESKQHVIVNSIKHNNEILPFRTTSNREISSAIAYPLQLDGPIQDVLVFASKESNVFTEQELKIIKELAEDVSLGLAHSRMSKQVNYMLRYDITTGLFNRESYINRLQRAIEKTENTRHYVAVAIVRIDKIDKLSELYGIDAVNRVLRHIAKSLMDILHEDDIVASIGAHEFGIILPDLKERHNVALVAEKIKDNLFTTIHLGPDKVSSTISVGLALYPQDGNTPHVLMDNAELALNKNPDEAQNSIEFYSPEFSVEVLERRKIEQELNHALERKELQAAYQPVVDARDGCVVGVEALARWHNEALGEVSPARFIPIAEHNGLIRFIGHWMLMTACKQYQHWYDNGTPVHIAVNVSVKQFLDNDFVDAVMALKETIPSESILQNLCLEVTENELITNMGRVTNTLRRLKEQGVSVYIDDFGTGFSSLSYLKELPFDVLKIDRKFIIDMMEHDEGLHLVKAIIVLAHGFDKRVIAEGVETWEQFELLKEIGCDWVQGYLFGRPCPAEDVEQLFGKSLL
jgi:diguanylate cyclase (GGDEF)-like protein